MCTNLEEVLKCDALIEFIRLLCARRWSCWLYPDSLMLSWDALAYVPCDPLKYWPPPTWLHQQCIWLFPSPVSHCEITAPPPPEQTWTTAEVRYHFCNAVIASSCLLLAANHLCWRKLSWLLEWQLITQALELHGKHKDNLLLQSVFLNSFKTQLRMIINLKWLCTIISPDFLPPSLHVCIPLELLSHRCLYRACWIKLQKNKQTQVWLGVIFR